MSLDVLNPVHLKRIKATGTIGVIDYTDFDKNQNHWVDPDYWGIVDDDSFLSLVNAPGGNYKDQTGCFIGDDLYVYGGEQSPNVKTGATYKYTITDPQTGDGSWANMATGQARKEACMDTNGIDCFAFGGSSGTVSTATNTLQKYTVSTNTWSILTNNFGPTACVRHDTCIMDGYIYTYGGWPAEQSGTGFDQLWRYDLSKTDNTGWEQLQGSGYTMINMVIVPWNGKIYSFGGVDPVNFDVGGGITIDEYRTTKNTLIYDPATDLWSEGSYCPFVGSETNGYVYNDKFYVSDAGLIGSVWYNTIFVYDFIEDVWTKRFGGGRYHTQGVVDCHQATGNMYMYGMVIDNWAKALDVWYNNDLTLAIRKV